MESTFVLRTYVDLTFFTDTDLATVCRPQVGYSPQSRYRTHFKVQMLKLFCLKLVTDFDVFVLYKYGLAHLGEKHFLLEAALSIRREVPGALVADSSPFLGFLFVHQPKA